MTTKKLRPSSVNAAERVNEIYEVMSMGLWTPGKSAKIYAKKWKISESAVLNYSAEAWRRVRAMVKDTEELQPEVAAILFEGLQRARSLWKFDSMAKLGDVLTKVTGARAAERHEYAHIVAHFDALDRPGKRAYFQEVIDDAMRGIAALDDEEKNEN